MNTCARTRVFEVVVDRADLEIGAFEGPERPLGLLEVLVGANDVLAGEHSPGRLVRRM